MGWDWVGSLSGNNQGDVDDVDLRKRGKTKIGNHDDYNKTNAAADLHFICKIQLDWWLCWPAFEI